MGDFIGGLQDNAKAAEREAQEWKQMPARVAERRHLQAVEYKVDIVRSRLVGDRLDHNDVELVLNDRAADGWSLTFCVATEVLSRVGPGGIPGLMLMFERPGPAA